MNEAIKEAIKAQVLGEVPVGALIVKDSTIISRGFNQPISLNDPTAHAEIIAIREAASILGNYRLAQCDLYVTLEPCMMCAGSFIHARINRVIFGAGDSRNGALGTHLNVNNFTSFNHKVEIIPHILQDECRAIIQNFFREKRLQSKPLK